MTRIVVRKLRSMSWRSGERLVCPHSCTNICAYVVSETLRTDVGRRCTHHLKNTYLSISFQSLEPSVGKNMDSSMLFVRYGTFLLCLYKFITCHSDGGNTFEADKNHFAMDQKYFLGNKLKYVFDKLPVEESIRRLRLLIPDIDADKNGFVEKEELKVWIEHKMSRFYIDERDVGRDFRDADYNFDEQVTWDEYVVDHYRFTASDLIKISAEKNKLFGKYIIRDKRRWKYADVNQDNVLNRTEFEYFKHPLEHEAMTRIVALEFIDREDTDGDGYISLEEFIASISMPELRPLDEKEFHEKLDRDHNGVLDVDEIEIWKTPNDFNEASREAGHLIEVADRNKDGKLSSEEIVLSHPVFVSSRGTQYGQVLHDEF